MFSAKREILVGVLFFLALLIFFTLAVMIAGEQLQLGQEMQEIRVSFPNVKGIQEGTKVNLNGETVGKVSDIVGNPITGRVELTLKVRRSVQLHSGYEARIEATLFGQRSIEIDDPGAKDQYGEEIAAVDMADVLEGTTLPDVFVELSRISGKIGRAVDGVNDLMENLNGVASKLNDPESGTLGRLIADPQLADEIGVFVQESTSTMRSFNQTAEDISTFVDAAQNGPGTLAMIIGDPQVKQDIKDAVQAVSQAAQSAQSTFGDVKEIVAMVRSGKGILGWLVTSETAKRNVDTVLDELAKTAPHLTSTFKHFDSITGKLDAGYGSLGRLINDDTLILQTEQLLASAQRSLDDLREVTPITTFASLLFQAFQ